MIEWADISDEETFYWRVLRAATPVIVAFEVDDCGYCRQQRQLLTLAWRQLGWSVPTLRVEASRLPAVAAAHRIVGYPTLAVFLDGRVAERFPGRRDADDLTQRLNSMTGGAGAVAGLKGSRTPHATAIPTVDRAPVVPRTAASR